MPVMCRGTMSKIWASRFLADTLGLVHMVNRGKAIQLKPLQHVVGRVVTQRRIKYVSPVSSLPTNGEQAVQAVQAVLAVFRLPIGLGCFEVWKWESSIRTTVTAFLEEWSSPSGEERERWKKPEWPGVAKASCEYELPPMQSFNSSGGRVVG
ncbi:hypothetical protein MKZ38_006103 [Zalerion maritima]|uniref:Uncharacterized protein n=1 Tax=Zalerion maritima TaxID=339359 RepID=A0AAD5RVM8_9PEZI|nr:hypothetical protein MKZ38_006103 [Zalerion maritima]